MKTTKLLGVCTVALVLAGQAGVGLAATARRPLPAAKPGHTWAFQQVIDPITDVRRGVASLKGAGGTLVIKCDRNGPGSVYLHMVSETYLGSLPPRTIGDPGSPVRPVTARVDDKPPTSLPWRHDDSSAVFTNTARAPYVAVEYAAARKLAFRFQDYRGNWVDVVLQSDGDDAAVRRVFSTCGDRWPVGAYVPPG